MNSKKQIFAFIGIVFLLLGALFGANIMGFLFGNLGTVTPTLYKTKVNNSIVNDSGSIVLNSTSAYVIPNAALYNFSGNVAFSEVRNASDLYPSSNFTVDRNAGTIIVTTGTKNYTGIFLTYSFDTKTALQITAEGINNNSQQAVSTYASNGTTQMNIMNVVIILLLLVAVFAFFWKTFIGGSGGGSRGGRKGGGDDGSYFYTSEAKGDGNPATARY